MSVLNHSKIFLAITSFAILISLVGIMPVFASPYALQGVKAHPLTPVTAPTPYGNGTILPLVLVYNTAPGEDGGLADYNKAINFEKAKSIILASSNSTTTLQGITLELDKQRGIVQSQQQNIKRYNPDGSETQEYTNWWMQNYVVYRLEADGISAISDMMGQGMSFQTALNQVEQSMQQILSNYDVNGGQSTQQPGPTNPNANGTTPNPVTTPTHVTNPYVAISLSTDLPSYSQGNTIVTTGHVRDLVSSTLVTLRVFNPHNDLISVNQIPPASDGSFTKAFLATGPLWTNAGTYTIVAQYGMYANTTTSFNFNGGTGTSAVTQAINAIYPLQSGNQIYNIPYVVKGATVTSMNIFASKYTLEISLSPATSDGSITVTLPRNVIDAKIPPVDPNVKLNELQDDKFIVAVGDVSTPFSETKNEDVRILSIPFHAGDTKVDIVGTVVNAVGTTSSNEQNPNESLSDILKQRYEAARKLQEILNGQTSRINITIAQGAGASAGADCVAANNCFSPNPLNVAPETKITWTNNDKVSHTITSGHVSDNNAGSLFDSGLVKPGNTFQFTFSTAGAYNYFCTVHPWMIGQVIVGMGEHEREHNNYGIINPTQQDIQNINQAKTNQTIAAEENVGGNQSQTTSIDNNVSVKTTQNTPDSLGVQVTATNQTGPKVIAFNLNATTINVQNLKDLGVMYDGKLIQPAPNMDAILHAKPTDNPSFAIVVTQSGIQVLVLVPHFSTHSITIMNMSKVMTTTIPEFPFAVIVLMIATFSIIIISRMKNIKNM